MSVIMAETRTQHLHQWAAEALGKSNFTVSYLAGDASFRHYYRLESEGRRYVLMDAPPELEDSTSFVRVATEFKKIGLRVPEIHTRDLENGFLLLEDFGDDLYFKILNENNVDRLYTSAINELIKLQQAPINFSKQFSSIEPILKKELLNFREWFLLKHLQLNLSAAEEKMLGNTFHYLVTETMKQPQITVHRDYHSRNLLALPNNQVGIIDFQDAVLGPLSYDLVSLIRDCYIAWPENKVFEWTRYYHEHSKGIYKASVEEFYHAMNLMGLQRHLKASFIFARKYHRDGSVSYLQDIPRTLNYALFESACDPNLSDFHDFLKSRILK